MAIDLLVNPCKISPRSRNNKGYARQSYQGKLWYAHRLAYFLAYGDIPKGEWVLHRCNNRACCEPTHLELGDHRRNMQYMSQCGRHWLQVHPDEALRGSLNGHSKLTDDQVRDIRVRLRNGESRQSIARTYGVVKSTIGWIAKGITWKHLCEDVEVAA